MNNIFNDFTTDPDFIEAVAAVFHGSGTAAPPNYFRDSTTGSPSKSWTSQLGFTMRVPASKPQNKTRKTLPGIKRVFFNKPATIIFWDDGSKTVVKATGEDDFSPEHGLLLALTKKAYGKGYYRLIENTLNEAVFSSQNKQKAERKIQKEAKKKANRKNSSKNNLSK